MNLLDLPEELIAEILQHVFGPWSAEMDLTCQLRSIPNIQILRTCSTFSGYGLPAIKRAFTGEFVRYDNRGCIKDPSLKPHRWYSFVMQNTRVLHMKDAYFTIWYFRKYWEVYPMLESFVISVIRENTYNNPAMEMPDYMARKSRCDLRTQRFERANYAYHAYLLDELYVPIYRDMIEHDRIRWPSVMYQFYDCHCHRDRQTIMKLEHRQVPDDLGIVDESFIASTMHCENGLYKPLHEATLFCVAVLNDHGFAKSLKTLTVSVMA